jgi:outer membrane pore protein E
MPPGKLTKKMEGKMNNKMMIVVVPTLLAASSTSATNLYDKDGTKLDFTGSIRIMLESGSRSEGTHNVILKDQGSRFGLAISHDLKDNLSGFGYLEYGNDTQVAEDKFKLTNRLGYVGLKYSDVGTLSVGRVLSPFDAVAHSDYSYEYGGVLDFGDKYIGRSTGNTDEGKNNFIGRVSNTIRVMSANFNGFSAGGTYTLQQGTGINQVDNAYTLAAFYNTDFGLNLSAGYGHAEGNGANTGTQQYYAGTTDNIRAAQEDIWGGSIEYIIPSADLFFAIDIGQLTLKNANGGTAKNYAKVEGKPRANLFGFGSKWNWGHGNIYGGYYLKDGNSAAFNWKEQKYVAGADYPFTRNFIAWAEYAYVDKQSDLDKKKDDNLLGLGLRVYF